MDRKYLTRDDSVTAAENNLVHLSLADGTAFECLEPRRLFPVNRPNEYITLLDSEGVERAVIRNINELSPESAKVVRDSLEDYYLVPQITRIIVQLSFKN